MTNELDWRWHLCYLIQNTLQSVMDCKEVGERLYSQLAQMRVFIPSDLQFVALERGNVTGNLFEEGFVRLNALNP